MNKLKQVVITSTVLILLTLGFMIVKANMAEPTPLGSVGQTQGYSYTNFSGAIATSTMINAGVTMLGSVVILEDQVGVVTFYDATSTEAIGTGLEDKMAVFQSAETEGTYTFDSYVTSGLVMVSADGFSFAGDWTVTWRQGW